MENQKSLLQKLDNTITNIQNSTAKNYTKTKSQTKSAMFRFKQMFNFDFGPLGTIVGGLIVLFLFNRFVAMALNRLDYTNMIGFIGYCINIWSILLAFVVIYFTFINYK